MTERIITDSNGRKHITNEPQLHLSQREPLTDKAITKVINLMPKKMKVFRVDWDLYEFARAIEAAHGIKENT